MIRRDKNRANVIIWSIANETPHSAERDAFLGRLARYARSQDYYNMKGLVSDSGQRKKAWYVLKEWYEGK